MPLGVSEKENDVPLTFAIISFRTAELLSQHVFDWHCNKLQSCTEWHRWRAGTGSLHTWSDIFFFFFFFRMKSKVILSKQLSAWRSGSHWLQWAIFRASPLALDALLLASGRTFLPLTLQWRTRDSLSSQEILPLKQTLGYQQRSTAVTNF